MARDSLYESLIYGAVAGAIICECLTFAAPSQAYLYQVHQDAHVEHIEMGSTGTVNLEPGLASF